MRERSEKVQRFWLSFINCAIRFTTRGCVGESIVNFVIMNIGEICFKRKFDSGPLKKYVKMENF